MRVTIEVDDMLIIVQKYKNAFEQVTFVPAISKPATMSIDAAIETVKLAQEMKKGNEK